MIMNLILSGQITSDFYRLGSELSLMGELLDQIGSKVRDYQKDSLETYKNYETYMLEAKGALSSQFESHSQLERVMESLHEHAQEWAATTIFDTKDVSKAISEAAHAGWTYEEMVEGIPQAMLLAQAGNLSLADSLDYVIKALNATGTDFKDGKGFIDQWVMAANSGATTVDQLGDAIIRMGGTSRFTDSTAEMFTMLAVLADIGTVGPDAGTALRNSMIRLIAPTDKASKIMADLNVSTEEYYALAADDAALKNANKLLTETGFSAYDSNGNLKPFLQTYKELYGAVSGMSEVDSNAVLSAIFPTRTIASAMGILEAASKNYDGLYEKISDSAGYADWVAETQTSGLMGAEKAFESKQEEFSRKVGETLAPVKEDILGFFGEVVDFGNEMPEEQLAALVGAMTGLAATGPALTAVGGAIKLAAALGPLGSGIVVASVALGAFVGYANKLAEIDLQSTFGDLDLDIEKLGGYVDSIEGAFSVENSAVSQYATALETAKTNYTSLTQTLEEDMLSALFTGKELTQPEIDNIANLGTQIGGAVLDGIRASRSESLSLLDALFGDAEEGSKEAEAYQDAEGWVNSWANDLLAEANALSMQLRSEIVSALMDGELSDEDYAAISAQKNRIHQIFAEIAADQNREDYLAQLYKAQGISWDSLETFLTENAEKLPQKLLDEEEAYYREKARIRTAWEHEYEKATTDAQRRELEKRWENEEAQLAKKLEESKQNIQDEYSRINYEAFDSAMLGSEHGQAWDFIKKVWENENAAHDMHGWNFGDADLSKYLPQGVTAEEMEEQLYDLWQGEHGRTPWNSKNFSSVMEPFDDGRIAQMLESAHDISAQDIKIKPTIDTSGLDAMLGGETAEVEATVSGDTAELEAAIYEQDGLYLVSYVEGDTTELESDIDDQDRRDLTANVDGDVSGLIAAIEAVDGMRISVKVNASGLSSLGGGSSSKSKSSSSISSSLKNMVSSAKSKLGYAEGGRATEASIFGEAGPEWAIPEEHSDRTASLLDQARKASGFTWGDLINRNGGLNGTPNNKTVNLTYAPTINAGNADGVERALASDKNRLMAMLRSMMDEMNMRDDAEVYA